MQSQSNPTTERPVCAAAQADAEPATPHLAEPGYMSCPRECGVDVREHNSSGLIDGRCDTDYWLALAADLRAVADLVGSLAGTPAPEVHASLSLRVGSVVEAGHEERRPVVEAIAAALGGTAWSDSHSQQEVVAGLRAAAEHARTVTA